MTEQTDDRMSRLATAARGVRMAIDVLGQEIKAMEQLNDVMKIAIDGLQSNDDGKEPFDIPNGVKPAVPVEKLHFISGGE